MIKDILFKNVKIKEILYDIIVWIYISKEIVINYIDLYIVVVYILLFDFKFYDIYDCDLFMMFNDSIIKYIEFGNIFIIGDFNVRIGVLFDYIDSDGFFFEINNYILEVMSYIFDIELGLRLIMDRKINIFGRKFINICKLLYLCIVNGCYKFDLIGSYIYCGLNGWFVVDFVFINLLFFILYFKVNDLMEFLDYLLVDFFI